MLIFTKSSPRFRYIEYQEGAFIETRQTKENCHLAVHEQTQLDLTPPPFSTLEFHASREPISDSLGAPSQTHQALSPPTKKRTPWLFFIVLVFVALLAWMCWTLGKIYLEESSGLLSTLPQTPVQLLSSSVETTKGASDAALSQLTYALHLHHEINHLYEEGKTIMRAYGRGELTYAQRTSQLQELSQRVTTQLRVHEAQMESQSDPYWLALADTSLIRLEHYQTVLQSLESVVSRVQSVALLNQGIEADTPFFDQHIDQFKQALSAYEIPYVEMEGRLQFTL